MPPRKKSNLPALLSLVAIVVLAAGGYFLYTQFLDYQALSSNVDSLKSQIDAIEQKISSLKTLENQYQEASTQAEEIPAVLPETSDIPNLLVQLENIAYQKTGMAMDQISLTMVGEGGEIAAVNAAELTPEEIALIEGTIESQDYKTLNFSANLSGTYQNFKNYLKAIETNQRVIDITSISFDATPSVTATGGPTDVFNYTVNYKTYYIK